MHLRAHTGSGGEWSLLTLKMHSFYIIQLQRKDRICERDKFIVELSNWKFEF